MSAYECAWCGHAWGNQYSAAVCCDELSNSAHDDRLDRRYDLSD